MGGVLGNTTSKEEIDLIIRSVDADNSGTIDFDEFLALMLDPRFNNPDKDEHRQVFEMFDTDGSGHISVAELKSAFRSLGQLSHNFSSQANLTGRSMIFSRPETG